MIIDNLENILRNTSFISIFSTMLFFWIKACFFYNKKTSLIETILLILCNIVFSLILIVRWVFSHHFPLSNLYESLIFLSWGLLLILILLQVKTQESFLGIILTPVILFINTFANFSLPLDMQKASALVPALQSNWLMMHVTVMILSYAALIAGSLLSLTYLILTYLFNNYSFSKKFKYFKQEFEIKTEPQLKSFSPSLEEFKDLSIETNLFFESKIDNLSYRTIGIGFPLLTIGILSGAVWANETWGSYWSWDPKETWALITWIVYAIYLHSRIIKGWSGKKPALIASFGFLIIWICYLGVNIFGKGLHSYGWIES
jgi:cytochrome c-type biogenesis protein CcsB